jgi:hypothetical protein
MFLNYNEEHGDRQIGSRADAPMRRRPRMNEQQHWGSNTDAGARRWSCRTMCLWGLPFSPLHHNVLSFSQLKAQLVRFILLILLFLIFNQFLCILVLDTIGSAIRICYNFPPLECDLVVHFGSALVKKITPSSPYYLSQIWMYLSLKCV